MEVFYTTMKFSMPRITKICFDIVVILGLWILDFTFQLPIPYDFEKSIGILRNLKMVFLTIVEVIGPAIITIVINGSTNQKMPRFLNPKCWNAWPFSTAISTICKMENIDISLRSCFIYFDVKFNLKCLAPIIKGL